jgi:hypothetical protein
MLIRFCTPTLGLILEILILTTFVSIAAGAFAIAKIHPFLAKNAPLEADILVVEGWLPDYALEAAMNEFKQGSYRQLVTIGGSIPRGSYLIQYKTFAELAAATLTAMGFETKNLLAISHNAAYNAESISRTDDSATELKQRLLSSDLQVSSFNLMTLGTHSRRSWMLFRKSFEPQIHIGIIAVEPRHYDPRRWWQSSEGTRTILSEFIAYVYICLLSIRTL